MEEWTAYQQGKLYLLRLNTHQWLWKSWKIILIHIVWWMWNAGATNISRVNLICWRQLSTKKQKRYFVCDNKYLTINLGIYKSFNNMNLCFPELTVTTRKYFPQYIPRNIILFGKILTFPSHLPFLMQLFNNHCSLCKCQEITRTFNQTPWKLSPLNDYFFNYLPAEINN